MPARHRHRHGRLIYDGDLRELVRRVRPDKRVTIRLSAPVAAEDLARLGKVVSADAAQAVLAVPAAQASAVVRDALATLPIVDLTVESRRWRRSCASCSSRERPIRHGPKA